MAYLITSETKVTDFSSDNIYNLYNKGFVFTRKDKGSMVETRSLRIDLSNFILSSENKRILNKNLNITVAFEELPLEDYSWEVHSLGKNFYSVKFGDMTMSASKIKEMFTDMNKSNMNAAFTYSDESSKVGYCLAYSSENIIHYAYPFYNLDIPKERSIGMAMMLKAITFAKDNNKKYIYLGSVADSKALYKLQFEGLEWWDAEKKIWDKDIAELKNLALSSESSDLN
jgi:arginyl-tRNA--protein-N-Asp/Glu arginylyltransferase